MGSWRREKKGDEISEISGGGEKSSGRGDFCSRGKRRERGVEIRVAGERREAGDERRVAGDERRVAGKKMR